MKIGIISDIHSNLEALEKVYRELEKEVDEIYCLGDIVGYGPNPNECIKYLRHFKFTVLGNHDAAVVGIRDYNDFNASAQFAIEWTINNITPENFQKLQRLKLRIDESSYYLVHGSLREPTDEYLINYYSVLANFELMEKKLCFFGHSHLAGAFVFSGRDRDIYYVSFTNDGEIKIEEGYKYLINPGSVGQPRDGNWKASFGIFDTQKKVLQVKRVEYDVVSIQRKMQLLGFPSHLWERLQYGR
ncbi:MAG TPA: metallophosphoesterase family protein [Dictyoglomaceae bacterium]|nr:metallophosphoesterase family protein [Dictyoglomaceae bacterium]HOL38734.1 metallophosphoesterase family protein [Dictyoglomaceae bacterium]HOP94562.1 metallophosphoesterase family protein [Dictyoglomaceae bacterium]HPP15517.1 metallophosphoesterase family protein [Dictyoglomaceae bacterium]HPU43074.1 metallophosphoesterase family protein [Dictyoglomaceae bacterium]